ncbi:hypothetical protein Taro_035505, partial [Colocasia esculenta]|nr:hypothetical protein [Colocasia esculenta]
MRRVLNAIALVVAFLLPPLSVDVCMRTKCCALGGPLTTPSEQSFHRLCSTRGEPLRGFAPVKATDLAVVTKSRQADPSRQGFLLRQVGVSRSEGDTSPCRNFSRECGTVEVCVIFLDTLTPVFELYVRLRERRQVPGGARHEPAAVCLQSRFDLFEVCPGVGTVVTAIVACGVPEWWHISVLVPCGN